MTVYEKLQNVQSKLKCPKNQINKFGGYSYRNLEDIMEAAKPVLKANGAALTVGDELVMLGNRFYIKATATFIDTETGEKIENTAFAREPEEKKGMDASQITGTASSYARKYAMNGLFCLDDNKDVDSMDNSEPQSESMTERRINDECVNNLKTQLERTGISEKSMLKNYDRKSLADFSYDDYEDAMSVLKSRPDRPAVVNALGGDKK